MFKNLCRLRRAVLNCRITFELYPCSICENACEEARSYNYQNYAKYDYSEHSHSRMRTCSCLSGLAYYLYGSTNPRENTSKDYRQALSIFDTLFLSKEEMWIKLSENKLPEKLQDLQFLYLNVLKDKKYYTLLRLEGFNRQLLRKYIDQLSHSLDSSE